MYLFQDSKNRRIDGNNILESLKQIGATECKTLFIHSDIVFGAMNPDVKRRDFMQYLLGIIYNLNVENIIMPTFTYSFCNNKDFDVTKSKSLMGALSEFFRKSEGVYRTVDPLLSFAIKGNLADKIKKYEPTQNSLGKGSYFDFLTEQEDVKYLFFGADMADCFTYVHHVERLLNVPYRFDMEFNGNIVDENGNVTLKKWIINTQCAGVKLYDKNTHFKNELIKSGDLSYMPLGDKEISCIDQKIAKGLIENKILANKDRKSVV